VLLPGAILVIAVLAFATALAGARNDRDDRSDRRVDAALVLVRANVEGVVSRMSSLAELTRAEPNIGAQFDDYAAATVMREGATQALRVRREPGKPASYLILNAAAGGPFRKGESIREPELFRLLASRAAPSSVAASQPAAHRGTPGVWLADSVGSGGSGPVFVVAFVSRATLIGGADPSTTLEAGDLAVGPPTSSSAVLRGFHAAARDWKVGTPAAELSGPSTALAWLTLGVGFLLSFLVAWIMRLLRSRAREARDRALENAAELEYEQLLARSDALTGLPTRRRFEDLVHQQKRDRAGLLLIDIDGLRNINLAHGSDGGDEVLRVVASRLRRAIGPSGFAARWGGDELACWIEEGGDWRALRRLAIALRRAIGEEPIEMIDDRVAISVSVGATLISDAGTLASVFDDAERALFIAKQVGGNRVCVIDELDADDVASRDTEALRVARALAESASGREGVPTSHPEQVAALAAAIARELDLPAAATFRCRLAGWLHDIGKVVVPDEILSKEGALTDDERELIRQHPVVGERMVKRTAGLVGAATAVRHHHERVDGDGYPDGLTGDHIPIEARIVAAADAYSAMVMRRPYQPIRSTAEAVVELQSVAGRQLDERVVEALVSVLETEHPHAAPKKVSAL
jgi:diguanylate cyclase (GGDEF)-like protein